MVWFSCKSLLQLFIDKRRQNDLLSLFNARRQQSDILVQQLRRRLEENVQLRQVFFSENKEQLDRQPFVLKDRREHIQNVLLNRDGASFVGYRLTPLQIA